MSRRLAPGLVAACILMTALLVSCSNDEDPVQPECNLSLQLPNGGEVWKSGQVYALGWQSDGPCGSDIRIELLHDGQACLTIADSTADDGTHLWTCEPCSADTAEYRVRIKDLNSGRSDRSSAEFIISEFRGATLQLDPAMDIDRTVLGDILPILWHSSDIRGDQVRIELLCSGTVCDTIAASVDNIGSFSWVVAASGTDSCGYTIRITDLVTGALNESTKPFCILTVPPPITVTSPNGGELWAEKSQYDITWDYSAVTGDSAGIELLHGGEVCLTITANTDNDGSFPWTAVACGVDSAGYAVRVTDLTTGYADESDSTFTLSPTPSSLTVTYPVGGEQWHAGSSYAILWSHEGAAGEEVAIELLRGSSLISTISGGTENDGSFLWTAVALAGDPCAYTIRITDPTTGVSGESDSTFCIIPTPTTLSVTYPNGGEEWEAGSAHDILWSHTGAAGDSVVIELLCNSALCDTIVAATLNNGRLTWVAAVCINDSLACDSCSYTVRITDLATGATDASDAAFCIPPPALIILSPNGGEAWRDGISQNITWTSTGTAGDSVKLLLLRNGTMCDTIASSAANSGSYSWTPGRCGSDSSGYQVCITDLTTTASDESDAAFTIPPPILTVSDPDGGEQWVTGTAYSITWNVLGTAGDSVKIELLQEEEVCVTITVSAANSGSFWWTAARCGSDSCDYRVRVTDLTTGSSDQSDNSFCILVALTVTAPNGGEIWNEGTACEISWSHAGPTGESVSIELLRNGSVCDTITSSTDPDGSFSWLATPCAGDSSGYTIRVTDNGIGATDASDSTFSIIPTPSSLSLTYPNGGELWIEENSYAIIWTHAGVAGSTVLIELLRDGSACDTIAASAANSGNLPWTAARCGTDSTGYRVRITDPTAGVSDVSDTTFSISPHPSSLTVTYPNGGETWDEGTSYAITWTHAGSAGDSVRIELLRSGTVCDTIASHAANSGSYPWSAALCGTDSSGYTVRVTDLTTAASDVSNAPFIISPTPSSLTVIYPNGGEILVTGSTYGLSWTHAGPAGDNVKVELLRAGSLCATISSSTPIGQTFPWVAAPCAGDSCGYAIRVTDLTTSATDTSDATFSIPTSVGMATPMTPPAR